MDLGIDLGTTFSVLAVDGKIDLVPDYPGGAARYLADCDVTIIPSPVGEYTFPSVMIPDPDDPSRWLFGVEAAQKADDGLAPVMFSKRKIGTTESIPVAGGRVTAREVAGHFLRYLKQCAEAALGRPVTRAVITHPAYFDRGAVEETRAAAREAGFDMSLSQQMLMEPVAAALCYTRADSRDPLRILTYDLGGGTFDVTYLERRGGVITVHAFDGNHLLGGYNFDLALVHAVLDRLERSGRKIRLDENRPDDRGRLARLLRIAEAVKIKLSQVHADTEAVDFRAMNVLVDERGRPVQVSERFTRTQFVTAIQGYLDEVLTCCRQALEKGKVRAGDLHEILLVGGSSRGPWVMDSLKGAFPQAAPRLFEPDLCVGAGAAIHARMALPRDLGGDSGGSTAYKVTLTVPESTLLEQIHVAGQVAQKPDGLPPAGALSVVLIPAAGRAPAPMPLARDGRFLFPNVELAENAENKFTLRLQGDDNRTVYQQDFSVVQGTIHGVATTTTVLPRALYIETARGLIALAEEGVPLPAKRVATFERSNANASIELRMFQEQDPVGLVRIADIPKAAGVGSPVVLTLEITADNRVHGEVAIHQLITDRSGKVVEKREALRGQIAVTFDPAVIPATEELRDQLQNARERLEHIRTQEPDFAADIAAEAAALVEKIDLVFARPIVERQEIHVALRKLRHLLTPPKDEMSPTRLQFRQSIRETRDLVKALQGAANEQSEGSEIPSDEDRPKARARSEKILRRLAEHESKLGAIEQDGLAAHQTRDRAAWENVQATLNKLEGKIDEIKKLLYPDDSGEHLRKLLEQEPFLLKILVLNREINPLKALLARYAATVHRKGRFEVWRDEVEEINTKLDAAAQAVLAIDDSADPTQIRAQVQVVLQSLPPLKVRIKKIGEDLN